MVKHSYGGQPVNIFMVLAQGSDVANLAWLAVAVSTIIVLAYKNIGHGAYFASAWYGILFTIMSILYEDDAHLLHCPVILATLKSTW